jgi:hypothetical protein
LRPPQSKVNLTSQDDWEYREISTVLASKLTRSGKAYLKQLDYAYYEAFSARKILSIELAAHRKRSLEDEERQVQKRLKKTRRSTHLEHKRDLRKTGVYYRGCRAFCQRST